MPEAMPLITRTRSGVFVAHNATVTGNVHIGDQSSLWFNAVVRGDVAPVVIGEQVNVQDGAVVHCDSGRPNHIGNRVSIGHAAVVHGEAVGDGTLIGMHATVLGRTRIGAGCLIAAGALVPPGMHVPDGMLAMGVPAKVVRPVSEEDQQYLMWLSGHYAQLAQKYVNGEIEEWLGNA